MNGSTYSAMLPWMSGSRVEISGNGIPSTSNGAIFGAAILADAAVSSRDAQPSASKVALAPLAVRLLSWRTRIRKAHIDDLEIAAVAFTSSGRTARALLD